MIEWGDKREMKGDGMGNRRRGKKEILMDCVLCKLVIQESQGQ